MTEQVITFIKDASGQWSYVIDGGIHMHLPAPPVLLASGRPEQPDFGRIYIPLSGYQVIGFRERLQMPQNPWVDRPYEEQGQWERRWKNFRRAANGLVESGAYAEAGEALIQLMDEAY